MKKTLTKSTLLITTAIAVLLTCLFSQVTVAHASSPYEEHLESVFAANPYFDKTVFVEESAFAPVIEAAYTSGLPLKDFLFITYISNSTYYPAPESFFYSTKPTITLNAATGVVMYQDDYANCMRYHNGEMAAEVAFYQTMLDSGIFTEVLREMGSNSYYSGIGLDWTQAINKRTSYMTALGYDVKDIYVFAPSKTVKGLYWYIYQDTPIYAKTMDKNLLENHANVMFTMPCYRASQLMRTMQYLDNMYVYGTYIQPMIDNNINSPATIDPDWNFQYPYTLTYWNAIDGTVVSPYTMELVYNY